MFPGDEEAGVLAAVAGFTCWDEVTDGVSTSSVYGDDVVDRER